MRPPHQVAHLDLRPPFFVCQRLVGVLILAVLLLPLAVSRAQDAPLQTIGRIEGSDISVEGGMPGARTANATPNILITNGSVVTVHSGEARMILAAGGEIDICGPAKLTLLESGSSITLALNFGHVHVRLPVNADLRLFTPTIIATPLDIEGALRDVALGLDLDDSLCVLATGGAIQLEHQFSGEKLIVPQTGEFFLAGGKLVPVAGKPGTCQCAALQQPEVRPAPTPSPSIPEIDLTAPIETAQAQPQPQVPPATAPQEQPNIELSLLAHANETHPVTPPEKEVASIAPPVSVPVYTVIVPPLIFDAHAPAAPSDPPVNTFLLVRQAHVDPNWEFSGHVDAPPFAEALQSALGEKPSAQPSIQKPQPKHRIWAFFRRIFEGNGSQD
jgi:hypothetical protein